jgi:anaerobic magnesium-protoporphyrin IX monomethyl ester cyclase
MTASVLLIGFQDQDNLGLRYLLSSVRHAGFRGEIATYTADPAPICETVARMKPDIVGFSLIFQYMAPEFGRAIAALRANGCRAHITIGGHYPSFDFGEVLERIPGADSVVRFEGEATLVELLERLSAGREWRDILGIAYRRGAEIAANPLRPAIDDLDTLPEPERRDIDYRSRDLATASLLGSRGCPWNCSFCSIRPFYEAQGGRLRRLRAPRAIAEEMRRVHVEQGARIFLFQDDDFLATGGRARDWARGLADEILRAGLANRIAFKISCRSDEVQAPVVEHLVAAGLTHVYMGVESGDADGLRHMNKMLKPTQHLAAGDVLRAAGLSFDFGFMLLEPYSTIDSTRANVDFLDAFVGDGWSVANFCRTLPYAGTPLKTQLEAEGRLKGTPFEPDYDFLDPRLDRFYDWMLATFRQRNFSNGGLCHILRALIFEGHLKLPGYRSFAALDRAYAHSLAARCNGYALNTLRSALDFVARTPVERIDINRGYLAELTAHELAEERKLTAQVLAFFVSVRERCGLDPEFAESFANSWTAAPRDIEAAVPIN